MKRIFLVPLFIVAVLFMGAVTPPSALPRLLEGARPGNAVSLEQLQLGERSRPLQSDGGGLLLWTADAGVATVTVTGGGLYTFQNIGPPAAGCHLCTPNPDGLTWDGGCSGTVTDPNYGVFIDGGAAITVLLRDTTTTLKAIPASGSATCTMPGWVMR